MRKSWQLKSVLVGSVSAIALSTGAFGKEFDIPPGDLKNALDSYARQSGVAVLVSDEVIKGARTRGVRGDLSADDALSHILADTGFVTYRHSNGVVGITRNLESAPSRAENVHMEQAPVKLAAASNVETVVVTSSKIKGDIQTVPIAITALSQEQLTSRQIAGGPDLVKEVPNLTFSKTNFTGYNIQIRGIGTQAISVTTDPAVAVAFNDTPFIRNHFFEQEFYDVSQVEVLRGPQGTLYGRNATAGVVNVVSAKPTDQFEAMLSADIGNYRNRRYEGMVNLPIVDDRLDLRVAGEWTKRDGYSINSLTNSPIDGRDLWSSRVSLRWRPVENVTADFIWEHFQEDDDRLRTGKQLCKRSDAPAKIGGVTLPADYSVQEYLSQGCSPVSLYSPEAFQVPNGLSLPYYGGLIGAGIGLSFDLPLTNVPGKYRDPYASTTQSRNLRVIESAMNPQYKAKNDTLEFNTEWNVMSALTFDSATGYNRDFLWSTEDFNRFNTQPGIFAYDPAQYWAIFITPDGNYDCADGTLSVGGNHCANPSQSVATGSFCDPQVGCSDRLVGEDLSDEHSWQFSQELRLASDFKGPFNFSVGGNYLHYETEENYYVFFNTLTMFAAKSLTNWTPGNPQTQNQCITGRFYPNPQNPGSPASFSCFAEGYVDVNPLSSLDNAGHNYFLSQNPYRLNSYALFSEAYYNVTKDLKLTGGLRWTDDQKHVTEIPSELLTRGYGYPSTGNVDQEWKEFTGRFVASWTPQLSFTDQTMVYASYAHGYKAGGANPPGAVLLQFQSGDIANPVHPKTFEPEFNDAFELGTKNTALDGGLTLNGDIFYYNYKGYQISQIVDRTSVNLNFDATVKGAEIQATWDPLPGLKFGFAGGYEDARLAKGSRAIDLMDRTASNPNWVVVKPFVTQASNCVLPAYVVAYYYAHGGGQVYNFCGDAYSLGEDPITEAVYTANPLSGYPGFDPLSVDSSLTPSELATVNNGLGLPPNDGTGFYKNLSGNQLPNAPHYTASLTADYTMPVSASWAATLHSDFYWQSQSFGRVFNDRPYDKIRGYSNVNLALILTDASGWQVMGYVKNIFDTTAITGTFLNSDDTGLTTNIFLTDPRLYGVRITKNFDGSSSDGSGLFSSADGKRPQVWLTLGGDFAKLDDGWQHYDPAFLSLLPSELPSPLETERSPAASFDWEGKLSYQPEDSDWVLKAGIRYGRSATHRKIHKSLPPVPFVLHFSGFICSVFHLCSHAEPTAVYNTDNRIVDAKAGASERHTMLDFTIGKNVGIGLFGADSQGTISGGVRIAQLDTRASADFEGHPTIFATGTSPKYAIHDDVFDGTSKEHRSFRGVGPELTWDSNVPVLGRPDSGQITLDWGFNAAMLFGRQRVDIHQRTTDRHCIARFGYTSPTCTNIVNTKPISRSRRVTVPNLGGYVGLSARYQNAKISLGYRADEFFNAIDGGEYITKRENRGFYGPYLNLSIGFGG